MYKGAIWGKQIGNPGRGRAPSRRAYTSATPSAVHGPEPAVRIGRPLLLLADEHEHHEDLQEQYGVHLTVAARWPSDSISHPLAGGSPGRSRLRRRGHARGVRHERAKVGRAVRQAAVALKICGWTEASSQSTLRSEPHYRDEVEGVRQRVANRVDAADERCCMNTHAGGAAWPALLGTLRRSHTAEMKSGPSPRSIGLGGLQPSPRSTRRCDVVVVLIGLDAPPERPAGWAAAVLGSRHRDRPPCDSSTISRCAKPKDSCTVRDDAPQPPTLTLSRRSQHLRRRLRLVPPEQEDVIRVHTLTEATGDDATTALDLLTAVEGPLVRVTADAAYDTVAVYETVGARGATVVIPPARTATVSGHGPRSPARDRTIQLVKTLGRRRWKQASGYHRQGRVENAFFRYKSIIGDGLRARSPAGQGSEVVLGCEILNRMTALGRPVSYRIGR